MEDELFDSAKVFQLIQIESIRGSVHMVCSNGMVRHVPQRHDCQSAEDSTSGNDTEWTSQTIYVNHIFADRSKMNDYK